jgi:HSP20 family molecular chaperone IbpA
MADTEDKKISVLQKEEVDTGGAETLSGGASFYPPIDIWEDEKSLTIEAEMPGVEPSGLSVDLKDKTLTIIGKIPSSEDPGRVVKKEYETGDYYRQFTVSDLIDQNGITAKLKDGVLEVYLPKQAPAEPRKITVSAE